MASPTEQDLQKLRTALKRCSPQTIEAAVRFRQTGDTAALPTIVYGIIERHLAPENNRSLADAGDDTRLIEDLGIDSLTLLEIVLSIEETINISVENEELREIRTLGEVKTFIERKLADKGEEAAPAASKVRQYDRMEIVARLPQQPPFLFVDEAQIEGDTVRGKYTVRGDEFFLEGHFKDNPIMPAAIVFEAIGQAACLWVLEAAPAQLHAELKSNEVLFASMEEAHFYRRAKPGDVIELEATLERLRAPLAVFHGNAKIRGERLATLGHLVLAFGHEVLENLDRKEGDAASATAGTTDKDAAPHNLADLLPGATPPPAPSKDGESGTVSAPPVDPKL